MKNMNNQEDRNLAKRQFLRRLMAAGGLTGLSLGAGCTNTLPNGFVHGGGGGGRISSFPERSRAQLHKWSSEMQQIYGNHGIWGTKRTSPASGIDSLGFKGARTRKFTLGKDGISHHAIIIYKIRNETNENEQVRYLCWLWSAGKLIRQKIEAFGPLKRPLALGLVGSQIDFTSRKAQLATYRPKQAIKANSVDERVRIVAPSKSDFQTQLPLESGSIQPRRPGDPEVSYRTQRGQAGTFVVTWTGDSRDIRSVNGVCEFWYPKGSQLNFLWHVEFGIGARSIRIGV